MRMNENVPLLNNAKYPSLVSDLEHGFKTLRSLKPDLFFVSHGNQFDFVCSDGAHVRSAFEAVCSESSRYAALPRSYAVLRVHLQCVRVRLRSFCGGQSLSTFCNLRKENFVFPRPIESSDRNYLDRGH